MKSLLIAINSKYIHPNLAIRLLKKNTTYDVDIKEFTIKDNINHIYNFIVDNNYDNVGISCYIWNITIIKDLLLKLQSKNITIILGGPEVSYNAKYYLDNDLADYVIKDEGEEAFHLLLEYLDGKNNLDTIPNLYYKGGYTFDRLVNISKISPAYDLLDDVSNKIVYIETSRGCPFKCSYCMASIDNVVRFFDINKIKQDILMLLEKGARVIKFLDRTFNANKKHFIELIDFIINNHKDNSSFQFEITGDLLDADIIDYINQNAPRNLFRFEIGIQSTNTKTNLSVGRIQNNQKLFDNIKRIQDAGKIDLHLDLIAGLPYEDYSSFINTFNEVISLRPKELQLGFLKLLHGTRLYDEKDQYGYKYNLEAPYDILWNKYMTFNDIENIKIVEEAFEKYYNSGYMKNAMNIILDNEENPFNFFYNLGLKLTKKMTLEELFKTVDDYVSVTNYYIEFHSTLIIDYLSYFNVRPNAWWKNCMDKTQRNSTLRKIYNSFEITKNIDDLYKYSILVDVGDSYVIGIYKPNNKQVILIKKEKVCYEN